jgi:hypothetical protein
LSGGRHHGLRRALPPGLAGCLRPANAQRLPRRSDGLGIRLLIAIEPDTVSHRSEHAAGKRRGSRRAKRETAKAWLRRIRSMQVAVFELGLPAGRL